MGHRLPNHSGLCRNIHGHSYEAHVMLTGEPDARGMVMDYFDLSSLVRPIIDELDHCFLVDAHDSVMKDFLRAHSMKVVEINVDTTAENIAVYLLRRIVDVLSVPNTLTNISIRVYETEKTFAEVSGKLSG
ncbi:MAG: 6-carboxytetrahydropterin synthase [Ignavibacteria bacterium]|nr:6-carboxytetrahydropterin synthase [Ignavibacteria bacterium]